MNHKYLRAVILGTDIDRQDIRHFPVVLKFNLDFYNRNTPVLELTDVTDAIAEMIQDHSNLHLELIVIETDMAFLAFSIHWGSAFELDLTHLG